MKLVLRLVMGLLILGACASKDTGLRLHLEVEAAWQLTQLELSAHDRISTVAYDSPVEITVPETWASAPFAMRVVGLANGARYAGASVDVTLSVGAITDVHLALARLPCGEWCLPGSTTCVGDAIAVCASDARGCMAWTVAATACPGSCSLGTCVPTCIDECNEGDALCAGDAVRMCKQVDSDPCMEWTAPTACELGQTCSRGACGATCSDECQKGATVCMLNGVATCGDRNLDGCLEWSPVVPCPGGMCENGVCTSQCRDECTAASCDVDTFRSCGQFDLDPCRDLSRGKTCSASDACQQASCTATGCVIAPKTCNQPPGPTCQPDGTRRSSDAQGSCVAGECIYEAHDAACPNCPNCEPCQGVVCNAPPEPVGCYKPQGTCRSGSCAYGYDNRASCDDGNKCTARDTCSEGACVGTPVSCNTPPANSCDDARTARVYQRGGTCKAASGSCEYASTAIACEHRCAEGACVECADATHCDDGNACTLDVCTATGVCTHGPLDADGDGHIARQCEGDDCDDTDNLVFPGQARHQKGDKDYNCDGVKQRLNERTPPGDCFGRNGSWYDGRVPRCGQSGEVLTSCRLLDSAPYCNCQIKPADQLCL